MRCIQRRHCISRFMIGAQWASMQSGLRVGIYDPVGCRNIGLLKSGFLHYGFSLQKFGKASIFQNMMWL